MIHFVEMTSTELLANEKEDAIITEMRVIFFSLHYKGKMRFGG